MCVFTSFIPILSTPLLRLVLRKYILYTIVVLHAHALNTITTSELTLQLRRHLRSKTATWQIWICAAKSCSRNVDIDDLAISNTTWDDLAASSNPTFTIVERFCRFTNSRFWHLQQTTFRTSYVYLSHPRQVILEAWITRHWVAAKSPRRPCCWW